MLRNIRQERLNGRDTKQQPQMRRVSGTQRAMESNPVGHPRTAQTRVVLGIPLGIQTLVGSLAIMLREMIGKMTTKPSLDLPEGLGHLNLCQVQLMQ